MNRFFSIIKVLALLFLSFNVLAEKQQNFLFTAKVKELGFQHTHIQLGRTNDEVYQATLPGFVFLPPRPIKQINKAKIKRNTPYLAAVSEYSSWRNSDKQWIVDNFVPDEQETVKNYLQNKKVLKQNKELFSSHKSTEVWGVVFYKDYALVLVSNNKQKNLARTISFKKIGDEWKRTHILADDLVVDLVNNAFRRGQVTNTDDS